MHLDSINQLRQGSPWQDAAVTVLPVPTTDQVAIALEVNLDNYLAAWHWWRERLTHAYPLVIATWGYDSSWEAAIQDSALMSRWECEPVEQMLQIAAQTTQTDLDQYLLEQIQLLNYAEYVPNLVKNELEKTRTNFGMAPDLPSGMAGDFLGLEQYLFEWETQHLASYKISIEEQTAHQTWYLPINQPMALLILPISQGWQSLAYVPWFGNNLKAMPLIQQWQSKFGAELVCHYGTMLQFLVKGKAENLQANLFEIAWQQLAIAPCTAALPGISIRDHAHALRHLDRWFLHERP
ncbi:MAG: DUF4253 domain-containing protein [Pseudanabaenaceae cyanobacterium bins.68]|nr:DUF4253 domain-containing protein [Pseudanabaenaceae cyanobacterium bins.68]